MLTACRVDENIIVKNVRFKRTHIPFTNQKICSIIPQDHMKKRSMMLMNERQCTCCFTGHWPERLPWGRREGDPRCAALKRKLYAAVNAAYESGKIGRASCRERV